MQPDSPDLRRWQSITAWSLFWGYVGYYVCRSNLSVCTPLILAEYAEAGVTKSDLGTIASFGIALYAGGKIVNGIASDLVSGRLMFLFGMVASIACTVAFGLANGITAFAIIWSANRFFQSMGWVALVKTASRWFPLGRQATIMGLLSMSFLLGDALVRLYLGTLIKWGEQSTGLAAGLANWRVIFFIAAATFLVLAIINWFTLKSSPRDVGQEEPPSNPMNLFGQDDPDRGRISVRAILAPLLRSRLFWSICAMNFGLTLLRETFNFWTPTYLSEVARFDAGAAGQWSLLFPLVGGISAFTAGRFSDLLGGRHGRVVVPSMACLIVVLVVLAATDLAGRSVLALTLICLVSFFTIAPYSYLSGVMAIDLGGKQGSSTAAGLIDSAGYVGAILSGYGIGKLAEVYGWGTAFAALAVVAAGTFVLCLWYWRIHEDSMNRFQSAEHNRANHTPDAPG